MNSRTRALSPAMAFVFAFVMGSGAVALPTAAQGWAVYAPTSVCTRKRSDERTIPNAQGTMNGSGFGGSFVCGLQTKVSTRTTNTWDLYVYMSDGDHGSTASDNVGCSWMACDVTLGVCYSGPTRYGNFSGGTTSTTANFWGKGYIRFTDIEVPGWGTPVVSCDVPEHNYNPGGSSSINGFYLDYY